MSNEYWADAMTRNCVWCYQESHVEYNDYGCHCGAIDEDGQQGDRECECGIVVWNTKVVFLTKQEALKAGSKAGYGYYWRVWGVPCDGIMAEILGNHAKEFESNSEDCEV